MPRVRRTVRAGALDSDLPEICPDLSSWLTPDVEEIDWPAALKAAGFTATEVAYLLWKVNGATREEAQRELAWTREQTERVRRSSDRKLATKRQPITLPISHRPSRSSSYVEKLESGRQLWTLRVPHGCEAELLRNERRNLIARQSAA
jgi:hypothetical protein